MIRELLRDIASKPWKKSRKRNVLLLASNEIMFGYTYPIYERLQKDKRIRPWFCFGSPPRYEKENLSEIKREHRPRSIPYEIARYLKWDLVLYPVHSRPFRRGCRKIYVGHGLRSGKSSNGEVFKYGRHARDRDNRIIYDKILAASRYEEELVRRNYPDFSPKIRVVGSLLADSLLAMVPQKKIFLENLGLDAGRETVMVASTWGPQSFAQTLGVEFMSKVPILLQKYNVILSVHQCNFRHKCSPDIDWRALIDKTRCANFYVSKSNAESIRLLTCADILVTDHTSLSLYYLLLGRPIVFYRNSSVEYEPGALTLELQKAAHTISGIENIQADIEQGFHRFDAQKVQAAAAKVCDFPGRAWERYEEEIYETLSLERYSRI